MTGRRFRRDCWKARTDESRHPNCKTIMALVLMAKATGKRVFVGTTGTLSECGHAAVSQFVVN